MKGARAALYSGLRFLVSGFGLSGLASGLQDTGFRFIGLRFRVLFSGRYIMGPP